MVYYLLAPTRFYEVCWLRGCARAEFARASIAAACLPRLKAKLPSWRRRSTAARTSGVSLAGSAAIAGAASGSFERGLRLLRALHGLEADPPIAAHEAVHSLVHRKGRFV